MPRVAFVTWTAAPDLTDEDRLAAEALRLRGIAVEACVWDDAGVDWAAFDRVIVRSTWDYHRKQVLYETWLRQFIATPGRLWNPPEVILGNLDKSYLIELARRGLIVVPTVHVRAGDARSLRDIAEGQGWRDVVIKPSVSGGADGAWRCRATPLSDQDEARFRAQVNQQALLVQPLMQEVATRGEWSLVFFHRAFSHAVMKRPGAGDFRVQSRHGGSATPETPDPEIIAQAARFLESIAGPLLYARVDGVEASGRFILMELEINEPQLFLAATPEAPGRFAAAIEEVL